jgi:O-antigen ligase
MLLIIALGLLAFQAVLVSPYGRSLKKGLDRTFSESRTASQRTSGRSDQWRVSYYAFMESLTTVMIGHGPGNGAEVYANYSREVGGVKYAVGKKVALHSLFMQMAVEAGCLGLFLLAFWLFLLFVKILGWTFTHRAVLPLVCFCGYVFVVITVSGNDVNSGILLGLAFLGTMLVPVKKPTGRPVTRVESGYDTRVIENRIRIPYGSHQGL